MARRPSDIIRRGAVLTGRKLLEAIDAAGPLPFGGRRLLVSGSGPQATIRQSGHPIIPKLPSFPAVLGEATVLVINRWEYPWVEVELAVSNTWQAKRGGRTSVDKGRTKARNWAEYLNNDMVAAYGVTLDDPPVTFTVKPIPALTPILLTESPIPSDPPTLGYWFEACNALDVECATGAPKPSAGRVVPAIRALAF